MYDPTTQTDNDPTVQLIKARLARQTQVNPLVNNLANAGRVLFGGQPGPDPLEQNLKDQVMLNQLRTGNPEFELQKAQTLANMGVIKDLQTKQLEADQVKSAADRAGATDNAPTMPPSGSMPQSGPQVPNGAIYTPSTPAFVAGIGNSPANSTVQPSTVNPGDNFDANKPKFIQEPGVSEFDPHAMAMIKKPGKQIIDPQWQAQLDAKKAADQDRLIKQQEQNATIDSSLNLLKSATAKYKNLISSNQGQGRIAGAIGQVKGALGFNAPNTTWEAFKKSAAPIFAAAASPRTPTLLVQYYMDTLGSAPQTNAEFEGRIGNLIDEQMARKSGWSGDFDTNKLNALKQEILSTPKENPVKMNNKPSFNRQAAKDAGYSDAEIDQYLTGKNG